MSLIRLKYSEVPGKTPPSLAIGELASNIADGTLFYGTKTGVQQFAFSGSGAMNTGSLLITASIVGGNNASNQILFTKGNGSTFTLTVNTGSGGGGGGTVTSIATAGLISGGPITTTGTISTSMNTNRLVGRSTAGTGIMEEITVGSGLSLSGGTLSATGGGGTFPFNGSAVITGSLLVSGSGITITGSLNVSQGITGSLFGTASYVSGSVFTSTNPALSSSYALSASYTLSASYASTASIATFAITSSYPISVTGSGNTLYSVSPLAFPNFGAGSTHSIFFGQDAGRDVIDAYYANFIGRQAGYGASYAEDSNFLGYRAGYLATYADRSNFLGSSAGSNTTYASQSNFFGHQAGFEAYSASNSNFLGYQAGFQTTFANDSTFIGSQAGYLAYTASNSAFIGQRAGALASRANNSIFIGSGSGDGAANSNNSVFLGSTAGKSTNSSHSIYIGTNAGSSTIGNNNVIIGRDAGSTISSTSNSILLGYQVGKRISGTGIGSNNVIIGTNISLPNGTSNAVNIGGALYITGSYGNTAGDPLTGSYIDGITQPRVGIGTFSPSALLHINQIERSNPQFLVSNTTGSVFSISENSIIVPSLLSSSLSSYDVVIRERGTNRLYITASSVTGGGGSGTPGGSDTQIQYNSGSTFAGSSNFIFNYTNNSLKQGNTITARGAYSHGEGCNTFVGQYGYHASDVTSGVITLDSGYGDVKNTGVAEADGFIILDDTAYSNTYGVRAFTIASVAGGPPTTITLNNAGITTGEAIIYIPGRAEPLRADILLPGDCAHSEGSSSIASGNASHAAGIETNAFGNYSYAGGQGTVATSVGQTVVGKYNLPNSDIVSYGNSFIIGKGTSTSARTNMFEAVPSSDALTISASYVAIKGIPRFDAQPFLLAYETSSGQIYFSTASLVGGGSTTTTLSRIATGSVTASVNVDTGNTFNIISGSSTFVNITNNGDVGIGAPAPSTTKLQISSSTNLSLGIVRSTTNAGYLALDNATFSMAVNRNPVGSFIDTSRASAQINLFTGVSDSNIKFYTTTANNTTPSERMIIDKDGNVGINRTAPTYTLDVSGSGNFTNNLTVTGSFTVITGSAVELQVTNTGVRIGNIITDTHTVTGSFNISGSTTIRGNTTITGSLFVSGNLVPNVSGGTTSSFTLGTAQAAWKSLFVATRSIHFIDPDGNEVANISVEKAPNNITFINTGDVISYNRSSDVYAGIMAEAATGLVQLGDYNKVLTSPISLTLEPGAAQSMYTEGSSSGQSGLKVDFLNDPFPTVWLGDFNGTGKSTSLIITDGNQTIKTSGSFIMSGSLNVTQGITGSLQGTSSFALTASHVLNGGTSTIPTQIVTGSVTASVTLTQFSVTSGSITEFSVAGTGVTIGNTVSDIHKVTGSFNISGSTTVNGQLFLSRYTSANAFTSSTTTASLAVDTGGNVVTSPFYDSGEKTYTGTVTWTGTGAPSGATTHSYHWNQVGNLVTLRLTLLYGSAGNAVTVASAQLPSDCPTPISPSGLTAASDVLTYGTGVLSTTKGIVTFGTIGAGMSALRRNSGNNGYDVAIIRASANHQYAYAHIQYYT